MRIQLLVLALTLLSLGCASSNLGAKHRGPSSDVHSMKDKYSDTIVYFCSYDVALVVADSEKCNEQFARGGDICTLIMPYISSELKVEENGEDLSLVNSDGTVTHTLKKTPDGGFILNGIRTNSIPVKWAKLTSSEVKKIDKLSCKPADE